MSCWPKSRKNNGLTSPDPADEATTCKVITRAREKGRATSVLEPGARLGVVVAQDEQGRGRYAWLFPYDETGHASRMPKLGQVRSKGKRGEARRAPQTAC